MASPPNASAIPVSAFAEFRAGAFAILPAAVAVIPFGLLLGALAAKKGLTALEVGLMSALVFAGSSQFVAIEIWTAPAPWALLGLTALTINLRHVMMSASVARHMGSFGHRGRLVALFFLADEIWAMAERRAAEQGRLSPWFYAGLAATLYVNWVVWTVAGTALGTLIANPAAWGFDFAFVAIFIGLIAGFSEGPGDRSCNYRQRGRLGAGGADGRRRVACRGRRHRGRSRGGTDCRAAAR